MKRINTLICICFFSSITTLAQVEVVTTEVPTISAGAEYSMYLEKLINEGHGKELEYIGTLPLLNKTNGVETVSTADGINFDEDATNSGYYHIPPDPIGAAGPSHIVSVTNTSIEWFTKAGVNEVSKRLGKNSADAIGSFFESLTPLTGTFDPKVIYDQYNGRFVVVALEQTTSPSQTSRILVAVSQTSNPNDGWYFTSINSKISISGNQTYADYPGLAVGTDAIYITANMFRFSTGAYAGGRLWIIGKTSFYSGGVASVNVYDHITLGSGYSSTYQPAHMFGSVPSSVGTFLVLYSGLNDGTNEYVNVIRVDSPLGAISFTGKNVAVGNIDNTAGSYLNAPQSGTSTLINTNDRRSLNAVWRNNSLWLSACVVPPSGIDAGQVTAHWFKVNTATLESLAISDQGNIGGEDIATGCYTFFPSISVNSSGDAIIGFSASAPTIYPGAYYVARYASTPPGTVLPSQVLKAGLDYYIRKFGGTRNRWGDYSGSSIDPSDDLTFYIFNEYALTRGTILGAYPTEDGRWGTAFGVVPTSALPVELSSFSASAVGSKVKLSWRTATETKNYGFEVERKALNEPSSISKYETVGFVPGSGNSNSPKDYSFTDTKVSSGKYSYRLKQIDSDGSINYSKIIEVDLAAPKKYELSQNYPNPFNPVTTINFTLPAATNVKLTLYNLLGEKIKTLVDEYRDEGVHSLNINANDLQSGLYIYKIEAGSFVQERKMMLLK